MTQKKIKHWQIALAIYVMAIAISSGIVYFQHKDDIDIVLAGTGENVKGFAWSDNFGWISFNGDDCNHNAAVFLGTPAGCPANGTPFVDYGVNINSADGVFSGYAWSENVGWINFSPAGSYPTSPLNSARYNSGTGAITGWAQVVSLGDKGWIKMSDGAVWSGVSINGSGDFSGWAWNGNDNDGVTGVGWISFNSKDCDMDSNNKIDVTCGSDNASVAVNTYKVSANMAPAMPAIGAITESVGTCKMVIVNWTDKSNNETGFEVQTSIYSDFTSPSTFCSVGSNATSEASCTNIVSPSTLYYFRVRALGTTNSAWDQKLQSISYCAPVIDPISSANYNCDRVNLSWTQFGTGVSYYDIFKNKIGLDPWDIAIASTTATSTVDQNIISGEKYYYKVKAQTQGLDSNIIGPINPCPNVPKWQETKTQ